MKKIIYSLLAIAVGSMLSGCKSLNLAPEDYYGSGSFWNNAAQVETYAIGLHSQLRNQYNMFFVLGEARGGTLRLGNSSQNTSMNYEAPIKTNTFTAASTGISNWNGLYSNILQVNHFIDQVENNCKFLSNDQKGYYLGEAYGIRALYYFMLYRTYGGVPLELKPRVMEGATNASDLYLERATAEKTLQQIKDDIAASEAGFGSSTVIKNKYTWSPYATAMLKAQVYIWSAKVTTDDHKATGASDLSVAKTALEKVIGKFSLMDNFSEVFTKKANNEVILSIFFDKNEATNAGGFFFYQPSDLKAFCSATENGPFFTEDPLNLVTGNVMRHEYRPTFVRSFEEADTRRAATFFEYYANGTKPGAAMKKYIGTYYPAENVRAYDSDVIVFRYADAILMMAEVENGITGGDPAKWVNMIRKRAYGASYPVYVNSGYGENELAIIMERDREFVGEGSRWFDLVRMHDNSKKALVFSDIDAFGTELGVDPAPVLQENQAYMILWPIDVTVLNADEKIKQNPGY